MGVMRPELVMKSIVPVVMAGVLGIYGLIIAVIISTGSKCCKSGSLLSEQDTSEQLQTCYPSIFEPETLCCSQSKRGHTILLV